MFARQKLNAAAALGGLAVAGLVAAYAGSWPEFVVVAVILLAAALHDGPIRPFGRQ